jgi:UDP:flavonoid glycosyltransferase YjiC (YdhE family)
MRGGAGKSMELGRAVRKRRFLVLTLDMAGNWPPELVLVRALVGRGHEVRVISNASHREQIEGAGAEYRPYRFAAQRNPGERQDNRQESEMARLSRTVFLNAAFSDELLAEVARATPGVVLVDLALMAAGAAAEKIGIPHAVLWHTVYNARVDNPFPLIDGLNLMREGMGLRRVTSRRESVELADAILAFTYEEFDSPAADKPRRLHYVGPLACLELPARPYKSRWNSDDARPLILVSFSTSFQHQAEVLQRVADAAAKLEVRVLLTLGDAVAAGELRLADNVVAERFVEHGSVLPLARLVVTHAGHGTVMAAATAGVPMVCMPMGRDQYAVSECVRRLGLGLVCSADASAEELREVMMVALGDEGMHERAVKFAAGLDLEAGLRRAIEVLEGLG